MNGDAIYCVAVKRCRRSRKTGFQHVQESGSSTAGNHVMASRRTTHHTTLGTTLVKSRTQSRHV
ncbi:TPA: hypothetical protein MI381_26910 [Klebsiella pneumoniae]|nr:hypothetical protein [Klebsiella pneumoniae]